MNVADSMASEQMDSVLRQDFDPFSPEALQKKPHLIGSLIDKVALITGASSGIGACTAELMAQLGAKLALTGRNTTALANVARRCQQVGDKKPLVVAADLCQENELEKLLEQVLEHYGKLDVLVNNAGILEVGSILETSLEQLDRVMNINVRSAYQLTHLAVPHLIATQGCIVNVSSVNGQRSFPGVLAYCMSKAAIDQFTRCTALELASKNVRVNAVCPGVIVTDIHKRAGMDEQAYSQFLEHCCSTHALGRPGDVQEVAQAIAFLASNSASFITGATLPVDGGRHAMCPR